MHARPSGATEDSPENRLNYWWRTPLNPNHRRRQSLWGAFDRAYHLGSLCGLGFARATFSVTPANRLPHAHHLAFPPPSKAFAVHSIFPDLARSMPIPNREQAGLPPEFESQTICVYARFEPSVHPKSTSPNPFFTGPHFRKKRG